MDTILSLIGEIGKPNLSTNAKRRLKHYNGLATALNNVETAFQEASETEQENMKGELSDRREEFQDVKDGFLEFLIAERDDLKEKKAAALKKQEDDAAALKKQEDDAAALKKQEDDAAALKKKEEENSKTKNSDSNIGGIILGFTLTALTFGAYAYFKNRN